MPHQHFDDIISSDVSFRLAFSWSGTSSARCNNDGSAINLTTLNSIEPQLQNLQLSSHSDTVLNLEKLLVFGSVCSSMVISGTCESEGTIF